MYRHIHYADIKYKHTFFLKVADTKEYYVDPVMSRVTETRELYVDPVVERATNIKENTAKVKMQLLIL